jgi:hypothetical protein
MIFVPATLALGIEIAAAILGLAAVLAMIVDRTVQIGFRPFDVFSPGLQNILTETTRNGGIFALK